MNRQQEIKVEFIDKMGVINAFVTRLVYRLPNGMSLMKSQKLIRVY